MIFIIFNGILPHIKAMKGTALDQYEEIVTDALKSIHPTHDFVYGTAKKDKFHPNGALLRQLGTTLPVVV